MNINYENLKVYITERPESWIVEIWVIIKGLEYDQNVTVSDGCLIMTKIEPGEIQHNPFLKLPYHFADLLFKSLIEYNSERGMKSKDENLLTGKLAATENHLNDMRKFSEKLLEFVTAKQ